MTDKLKDLIEVFAASNRFIQNNRVPDREDEVEDAEARPEVGD